MRLSAERYEQILDKLKSDSQIGKERRGEPRVGLQGEAPLVSVDETGKRVAGTVRVRDVSRKGIGMIFGQMLAPKQRFMIQLQYETGQPLWLVCYTTNCRAIEGGRFVVGARVDQLLRSDQIHKPEPVTKVPAPAPIAAPVLPSAPLPPVSCRKRTSRGSPRRFLDSFSFGSKSPRNCRGSGE